MFDILAFLSLPQHFACEVYAVLRHMRHSKWQDASSCNLGSGAIWHDISITPRLIWPDFSREKLKGRNSAATTFASFSTRRYWETSGAGVRAHQGIRL
jgi:hypothetical protein